MLFDWLIGPANPHEKDAIVEIAYKEFSVTETESRWIAFLVKN